MNYFDCVVGSGGNGKSDIIVTCSSDFAGKTITCTNGTDTYTQTCPSSSPYTVTFNVKADTWTISGVVSGTTYSDIVDTTAFKADVSVKIPFTLYSAPFDIISYTSNGTSVLVGVTDANGSLSASLPLGTYTFVSNIAKNPDNLSQSYTKNITISANTNIVYLMPDNALYWYGFEKVPIRTYRDTYGGTITKNTNDITIGHYTGTSNNNTHISTQNPFNLSGKSKIRVIVNFSDTTHYLETLGYSATQPSGATTFQYQLTVSVGTQCATYTLTSSSLGNVYVGYETNCYPQLTTVYALFVE